MAEIRPPTDEVVAAAAAALRRGELVAFPTETVYGLGADASDPEAVRRIFAAKGRPADHPVIVHVAGADDLAAYVAPLDDAVAGAVAALTDAFWPGPLTLVLPRGPRVPDAVTGGQSTVGVRSPAHPVAQRLLAAFGGPIAAPSANRFGRISPTRAEHVAEELGDAVALILGPGDGGEPEVGIESTIVAFDDGAPQLLRPGGIARGALERVLNVPVATPPPAAAPRASGRLPSHYAPRTPADYVSASALAERIRRDPWVGVLARADRPSGHRGPYRRLPADPGAAARELYRALRDLDAAGAPSILIETVPDTPAWEALRDRLERATTPPAPAEATPPETPSAPADRAPHRSPGGRRDPDEQEGR